jgi:hypothetical protein
VGLLFEVGKGAQVAIPSEIGLTSLLAKAGIKRRGI